MAYNNFAFDYDALNSAADYDALARYVCGELAAHGIREGIVADLGCGTGELTLRLAQAGYDMLAIDASVEMLSVLGNKLFERGLFGKIQLLEQDLRALDLFGTIRAAVSSFDTLNHIGPVEELEKAIRQTAFFMEKGGVFLFDMNTPYKHSQILGNRCFTVEGQEAVCEWSNALAEDGSQVELSLAVERPETGESYCETFCEYTYSQETVRAILEKNGFTLAKVCDGEDFGPLHEDSPRMMFTAVKNYTQLGGNEP